MKKTRAVALTALVAGAAVVMAACSSPGAEWYQHFGRHLGPRHLGRSNRHLGCRDERRRRVVGRSNRQRIKRQQRSASGRRR